MIVENVEVEINFLNIFIVCVGGIEISQASVFKNGRFVIDVEIKFKGIFFSLLGIFVETEVHFHSVLSVCHKPKLSRCKS